MRVLVALRPSGCSFIRHAARTSRPSRACIVGRPAKPEGDEPEPSKQPTAEQVEPELVAETVKELRAAMVDQATASRVVGMWSEKGIKDSEQLRKLYRKQSGASLVRFTLQRLLDAGACWAALSASQSLGNGEDFFARPVVVFIFASVALNYGLSFITNTISMGISIQAMMKFGTNAPAYFEAMKTIAGPVQLDALQSTLALVDGYKVGQALEEIDKFLKDEAENDECKLDGASRPACTIDSLAIYLTLSKARELCGFDAEAMGISPDDEVSIARAFAHYDLNDDFQLSVSELQRVFADAGRELSKEEAQAAMQALDEDGTGGHITFLQFARFWVDPKASAAKAVQAAAPPLEGAGAAVAPNKA